MKRASLAIFLAIVCISMPARAIKLEQSKDTFLNINLLLQFQAQLIQKGAPDERSWGKEFFLRRVRLLLGGQVNKFISFFIDTDMPNWGKGNDWNKPTFYIQDAFLTFKVVDQFMVDAGLIIAPFSRHGYQSAVALFGLEYHADLIKYPTDATKVWRDAGAQIRGYIFKERLQYRFSVMNGSKNDVLQKDINDKAVLLTNPKDYPRVTAHLRYNFLGTETDMFAKGIYFADKPVVSLGVSFDYQQDAGIDRLAEFEKTSTGKDTAIIVKDGSLGDYMGVSADLFAEIPFAGKDHEFIIMADFYRYWQGKASAASGIGLFGEFGYRYKTFSPVFGIDWFKSDLPDKDLLVIHGGLVWWAVKHNANIKLDAAVKRQGDVMQSPLATMITLQGQIYF